MCVVFAGNYTFYTNLSEWGYTLTNEQLCVFIQQDSTELLPILWGRVKGLCFMLCGRYYAKYAARFSACGVELCDLRQECYAAFLQAVRSFKEDKGMKFSSYLDFPIRNTAAELLGIRNPERTNHKPLDNAVSLDKPIEAVDNDNMTLADIIPDRESGEPFERVLDKIEDAETRAVIGKALHKLPEIQRQVITLYYFENATLDEIGRRLELSGERIRQIRNHALKSLRQDTELVMFRRGQRIERGLHRKVRQNSLEYIEQQERITAILRTGEYLIERQISRCIQNEIQGF